MPRRQVAQIPNKPYHKKNSRIEQDNERCFLSKNELKALVLPTFGQTVLDLHTSVLLFFTLYFLIQRSVHHNWIRLNFSCSASSHFPQPQPLEGVACMQRHRLRTLNSQCYGGSAQPKPGLKSIWCVYGQALNMVAGRWA